MDTDTIVALSTPPGESGIAVVRVSGRDAVAIVDRLAPGCGDVPSHTLHRAILRDSGGEPIDEALVAVMRAPSSYTGEDVVEISCHGSMQAVGDLLEEITRQGARLAGAGEFTKRAFLNGRIDLAQAEAVADLISSETKLQRAVAVEQLEGGLSRKVRELEDMLLDELSLIEASIDFSEDEVPAFSPEKTKRAVGAIRERIARLLASEIAGSKLRRGIRVTIIGPRNVGKSSLYNALLGEERAIVSSIPGTTRDILRERIHIGGFTCYLEDTAGLAETGCEIEAKGIMMGREAAGRADLVLFVVDGSEEIDGDFRRELERAEKAKLLCVLNKMDLGLKLSVAQARAILGVEDVIAVSALKGEGLEDLKSWIFAKTVKRDAGEISRERIVVNARQGAALRETDEALARLEGAIDEGAPAEILSVEAGAAGEALGKVTGRTIADEILDTIFSRFCVGK